MSFVDHRLPIRQRFCPQAFNVLRITVFLAIGILLADRFYLTILPTHWAAMAVALGLAGWATRSKETLSSVILLTGMIAIGGMLMSIDWQGKSLRLPEQPLCYKAVVSSTPKYKRDHWTCDLTAYDTAPFAREKKREYKLKAFIYTADSIALGDCMECRSLWKQPRDFVQNSRFSYATYLKRHGYAAVTNISHGSMRRLKGEQPSQSMKVLRSKLTALLRNPQAQEQDFAIIAAMTFGEKASLSRDTKEDYANAGVSHVLALSGLHLTILQSLLSGFLFAASRKLRAMIQLLFVWGYVFLTDMPLSLTRVALMFSIVIIADYGSRRTHSINTLSIDAFLILLFSPQSLFDIAFQLSFAATAAIIIMNKRYHPSYLKGMFLVPIAAQVGTLPLILYHFGQFPTYFLITNLFIIFFATVILAVSVLTLAVSFSPDVLAFSQDVLSKTASCMNWFVHEMAALPYSTIQNVYINIPQACICYLLIGALLLHPFRKQE